MNRVTETCAIAALMALSAVGDNHIEVGATIQDEAVAVAIDEGLSQDRYLSMSYGESAEEMLDAAFVERAKYFVETASVIRHLANGDIRNVVIGEPPFKGPTNLQNFAKIHAKIKDAFYKPSDPMPIAGRMVGIPEAFSNLVQRQEARIGKKIKMKGDASTYPQFDRDGQSYSFWPLGIAIHDNGAYGEEVAHFFNATDPRKKPVLYKGTWTSVDYERVSRWNEFLAALRGVKVYAFSHGINLNESHYTEQQVVDTNGVTSTVWVAGTPRFDTFYQTIAQNLDSMVASHSSPLATNSFVLLLSYREALSHEGKDTDNAAYRRFREMCRNFHFARMVL